GLRSLCFGLGCLDDALVHQQVRQSLGDPEPSGCREDVARRDVESLRGAYEQGRRLPTVVALRNEHVLLHQISQTVAVTLAASPSIATRYMRSTSVMTVLSDRPFSPTAVPDPSPGTTICCSWTSSERST